MTLNKKHCLLFLAIFVILIVGMTMASATQVEDVNNTQEVLDNKELSTPTNYDVDKMVQSTASKTSMDANVEKDKTNDNTNNSDITNKQTEKSTNTKTTKDKDITSKNNTIIKSIQNKVKNAGTYSFSYLANLLNNEELTDGKIYIEANTRFTYDESTDSLYKEGITITRNITVIGGGSNDTNDQPIIDANHQARIFKITGENLNINISNFVLMNGNSTGLSDENGGAIYVDITGPLVVDDHFNSLLNLTFITVINSYSPNNGGGAYLASPTAINGMNYTNNSAKNGGAVYVDTDGDRNFPNYNFYLVNNSAVENGGGLYIKGNHLAIENVTLSNNTAGIDGGGVYWNGIDGGLSSTHFLDNIAKRSGGGIYWEGRNGILNRSTFINNRALGEDNTTTTGGDGGAIEWAGSEGTIITSTFINNYAAYRGGAVFMTSNAGQVSEKNAIKDSVFRNNIAGLNGGAINFFGGSFNGTVSNSTFDNNFAKRSGGAVYWNGIYGSILDSKFNNNSVDGSLDGDNRIANYPDTYSDVGLSKYTTLGGNGGAVNWIGSNGEIKNSIFTNNTALSDTDNDTGNGGAVYIFRNENMTIYNSTFTNNTARLTGGAITIINYANHTTVSNSSFTSNILIGYTDDTGYFYGQGGAIYFGPNSANGTINESSFSNNSAFAKAGAIEWNGNDGRIISSNFTNNSAKQLEAGAVFWEGNHGNITGSRFIGNNAKWAGAALRINGNNTTVSESYFDKNYDSDSTLTIWGTAIYISGHNANISHSNFTNHKAASAGAVYVAGANTTIHDSIFINNNATEYGGAVLLNGTNGMISYSNFTRNNANNQAGALYINGTKGTVSHSHFTSNTAKYNAGAIFIKGGNSTIEYSNLINNTATSGDGGAMYITGAYTTISYTNMTSNSAGNGNNYAGDIYCTGNYLNIMYSNFNLSNAKEGGSMYLTGTHYGNITGCNFTNIHAKIRGGSIYWVSSNDIILKDTYFHNSSCGDPTLRSASGDATHGGAINFQSNSRNTIDNCTFEACFSEKDGGAFFISSNSSVNSVLSNCTFINCYSVFRSGGAICWKDNDGLIINNVFINCTSMSYDRAQYSGQGGAVYMEYANNNRLINDTFINCSALMDAAAIYYRSTGSGCKNNTHINCTFINNNVTRNGGVVYFATANVTFDGCKFINNTATNGGAIYYNVQGGIIIRNCLFENNTGVTNGGFLYLTGSNIEISNNTFFNGSATNGGAVYIDCNVDLDDSTFTNNTAENGGAVYVNSGTATLNNCNLTNNTAVKGSAVYVNGGKLNLNGVRLVDNQANSQAFVDKNIIIAGDKQVLSGVFTGWDNYLNGIYLANANYLGTVNDVTYLGLDDLGKVAIVNTDVTSVTFNNVYNESAIEIFLEIQDINGNIQTLSNYTDENGIFRFEFDRGEYEFKLIHYEDEYYTELIDTFGKSPSTIIVNVTNISYGKGEAIKVNVTNSSGNGIIPTGNVTIYVNSTLEGFINQTFNKTLEDGVAIFDETPLNRLNASTYDVYVTYTGDTKYTFAKDSTSFTVSPVDPTLTIDIDNYDYNNTHDITFNVNGIEDEELTGKILVNITGTESDGTEYSLNDIEVNITRDENNNIVNNTYTLPILNAGEYNISAYYSGNNNYLPVNNTHNFTVNKAHPLINVTTTNTSNDVYTVMAHIEPEISTGNVNIIITNESGEVKRYSLLELTNSMITQVLDAYDSGNYIVTVEYNGDKNHLTDYNTTSFTIVKMPTNLTIMPLSGVEIDKPFNITLNLTDYDGHALVGEPIEVYVNDNLITGLPNTNGSGMIVFNYTVDERVSINVLAKYGGTDYYLANTTSYIYSENNIQYLNSLISVMVDNYNIFVNQTLNIYGTLRDDFNNETVTSGTRPIANADITISIDENHIGTAITDADGYYSFELNKADFSDYLKYHDSEYIIKVNYDGGLNARYLGNSNTTRYKVNRYPTNLTIIIPDSGVEIDKAFNITLNLTDRDGEPLRNQTIEVIVNDEEQTNIGETDENGTITLSYTVGRSENIDIRANYQGTDYYADNVTSNRYVGDKIALLHSVISVAVDNPFIYINESLRIYGTLNDTFTNETIESGTRPISNGEINITINGVVINVTSDENGYYSFELTKENYPDLLKYSDEDYDIQVDYGGLKAVFLGISAHTKYRVKKYPTNLTILPYSDVKIDIPFNITLNLTDREGNSLKDMPVTVYVNTKKMENIPLTDENGTITFNYTVGRSEDITVEAFYEGNNYYDENRTSTWYDGDNIKLLDSVVSVEVDNHFIYVNETLKINGTLRDTFTNDTVLSGTRPISNGELNITVNDVLVNVTTTDENGYYSFELTKDNFPDLLNYNESEYIIKVGYSGLKAVYLGCSGVKTYKVSKYPTNLTIVPFNGVEIDKPFNITLNLTDRDGNSIRDEDITVLIDKVPVTITDKTDSNGILVFSHTVYNNKKFNIEATFGGNDLYESNSTYWIYEDDIILFNSSISLNVDKNSIFTNDTITISGTLNDSFSNESVQAYTRPIVHGVVVISYEDHEITTLYTDEDGYFIYQISVNNHPELLEYKGIEYILKADYGGEPGIILGASDIVTYMVEKIHTKTNVTILNTTVGNVTIRVNVTNLTDDNVLRGNISISDIYNNELVHQSITGGVADITIPTSQSGLLEIIVRYDENDIYYSSVAINDTRIGTIYENVIFIDVINKNDSIDISLSDDEILFDKTSNITGHVYDDYNNPITEGNVTIIINGVEISTVNLTKSGYSYLYRPTEPGTFNINARFNGIERVFDPVTSDDVVLISKKHDVTITPMEELDLNNQRILKVLVDDKNSSRIHNGKLIVTLPDSTEIINDVENGIVVIPIEDLPESLVTIKYNATDYYNEATTETYINLEKTNTTIELTYTDDRTTKFVAPEDSVTITVVLKDLEGEVIPDKDITLQFTDIDKDNDFVNSTVIHTDNDGKATFVWNPKYDTTYNITAIFDGRLDVNYNSASNSTSLEVVQIAALGRIFNNTEYHNYRFVNYTGWLFYQDIDGNPVNIADEYVNITIFYQNGTNETRTYKTNSTGNFEFNFTKEKSDDNFTIGYSYRGSNRYMSYDFKKIFDDRILTYSDWVYANRTVQINHKNLLTFTINDEQGTPLNGTFTIYDKDNNVVATVPVKDGIGEYNFTSDTEEHVYLTGIFTNDTVNYNEVHESINFYIVRMEDVVTFDVLNNTVYNTTLKVNVKSVEDESINVNGGEVVIYNLTLTEERGIELGRGTIVDGEAIIALHDLNESSNYTISVVYSGTTLYFANQTNGIIEVLKLNTSIEADYINNTAGNVSIRVDVTSNDDPSVNNGTVTVYLEDETTLIGTGNISEGSVIINITDGYLDKPDTYKLIIKYSDSLTFNDNSTEYEITLIKRQSNITANVTNNVAGDVTLEAIVTDAITGVPVSSGNITVKVNGVLVGNSTITDNSGRVSILTNITTSGDYTFTVTYNGNDYYFASSTDDNTETIVGRETVIGAVATNTTLGNTSIRVNLTDKDNEIVANAPINITLPDGRIINTTTNTEGIADVPVDIPVGINDLIITYPGNDTYNSSTATLRVYVEQRQSKTSAEIVNDTIGSVKLNVTVTDNETGEPVLSGAVLVTVDDEIVGIGYIRDINTTIDLSISEIGDKEILVEFLGNKNYTESQTTVNKVMVQKPTFTSITILNQTVGMVEIRVSVTNDTSLPVGTGNITVVFDGGSFIANKTLVDGKANITIPTTDTSTLKVNVTYNQNDEYMESRNTTTITVTRQDPVISISVNTTRVYVDEGVNITVNITDALGNQITDIDDVEIYVDNVAVDKADISVVDGNFTVSIVTGNLTVDDDSRTFTVNATYKGNTTVNGVNSSSLEYVVERIPSITSVKVINSTYGNVTIVLNVTDSRYPDNYATGLVWVYDFITNNKTLIPYIAGGNIEYTLPFNTTVLKLLIQYNGNDKYLVSNARNESAFELDKDVITINVNKAPSTTSIEEILSDKSGNVTLSINVTNSTSDYISSGHVMVVDANTGALLGEGDLDNGKVNITLSDLVEPGDVQVNVTYEGNDYYLASNVTSYPLTVKVDPSINITLSDDNVMIRDVVTITGYALNTTGQAYTNGHVNVTVNGVNLTSVTYDTNTGQYSAVYTPTASGIFTVNASYIADDDTIIVISEDKILTVNKIPTTTSVETINTTLGNITIRVSTVGQDDPDTNLSVGNITVYDINGNLLAYEEVLTQDGLVDIVLNNVTATGELKVKVTYNGNDIYLPSNAINISAYDTDYLTLFIDKIHTITSIEEVLNNNAYNVRFTVNVTNTTGEALNGGRVEVRDALTGILVGEGTLNSEGKVNITLTKVFEAGQISVNVTYMGDENYYPSNVTKDIRVYGSKSISIELDTDNVIIGENVTVKVNVTDDLGVQITDAIVNVTINGTNYTAIYNATSGFHEVQYNTTSAGLFKVNATYTSDDITSQTLEFTVDRIPTLTNVTVLNTTVKNVTLNITVKDKYENIITDGKVNITINGNTPLTVDLSGDEYTLIYLLDNITSTGNISITVEYTGNETYHASVANNTKDGKVLENITVTPRNSSITVTVNTTSTITGENITISGVLVDEMGQYITDAYLVIYVDGLAVSAKTNSTGGYTINYTTGRIADNIVVNATYDGSANYNPTSANTTFNVTKIATKTNVTINNSTIGNVVIHVNVTNTTSNPVERGHVIVRNQTGQIIGEGELVNGGVDITLNVTTTGNIKVNVTYQENDIYYSSNARNTTITDDTDPEVNITSIDVVKQEAGISIGLNPTELIVGENVYIRGNVIVDGEIVTTGKVNITVNTRNTTVDINSDGSYNLTYTATIAGEYTVNATYLGNDNITSVTSNNIVFTVAKMPTNTTITIVNNTIGHVVIEVSVTNNTGTPVTGKINVTFEDGTIIESELDIDGKVNVTIPQTTMETLKVNATYLENYNYYSSTNNTEIIVGKINSMINVDLNTTSLIIGESVTIIVNITDADGKQITDKENTIIYINGVEIVNKDDIRVTDDKLTVTNITVSAGTFTVNATYKGNTSVNASTSNTIEYTVNRIPTTIMVSIVNNTAGNVTLNISVTGIDNNKSMTGKVNITIDGKTIQVDLEGTEFIIVALNDNITRSGDINVTAAYDGNTYYMPSVANITDSQVLENITVANQTAILLVGVNETPIVNGSSIIIAGNLTDDMGNNISGAYVSVYVNGERVDTVKTNSTGAYNVTYITNSTGINNVLVTYDGDYNRYASTTGTATFDVIKLNTTVKVTVANIAFGGVESVNITVNESDATGSVTVYVNSTLEGFENITRILSLNDAESQYNLSDLKAGKYNVTLVYDGDTRYNGNKTIAEFTVLNTSDYTINLTAMNITYGDDQTITVTLPSDAKGSVTIGISGISISDDTKELQDGQAVFSIAGYTGLVTGEYTVTLSYTGDDNYAAKDDVTTVFNVARAQSHISITGNDTRSDMEASVVLNITDYNATAKASVTLFDEDNQQIGTTIPVDPMTWTQNSTVSFGKLSPGTYTVNVTYHSDTNYEDSNATLVFTVEQIPTSTMVTILNNTAGNVTVDIKVTGEDGNNTITGTVNLTVNGKTIPVELTGTTNKTVKLDNISSGINYISVLFTGNDLYSSSIGNNTETGEELTNITVDKQAVIITVKVNHDKVYVDENVTITGTLTNIMGEKLTYAPVVLCIDGVNYTTSTRDDGVYEYVYNATSVGEIEVNATFTGNVTYEQASNITGFNVTKYSTNTTVTIINTTIGNVTISVGVTDVYERPVVNGTVVVYDKNHINVLANASVVHGETGEFIIPVVSVGDLEVIVEYVEDTKYLASNATNNTQSHGDNITYINVTKQDASISINIVDDNVTIGDTVVIYGSVTDGMGKLIPTGEVIVSINGTTHPASITKGEYRLDNITIKAGLYDVNATFTGNANVSNVTSKNINYTVNKIATVTHITVANNTAGNVVISVTVTDESGVPVTMGNISVVFGNGTFIANKTLTDGKVNVSIPSTDSDTLEVNVTYNDNTNYDASNASKSIPLDKQEATITIELNTTSLIIGESVNITGIVHDGLGNIIRENVTVCIDEDDYTATFLDDGTYTVSNVTIKEGTFTVNATYTGNATVGEVTSNSVNFTVNRIPTILTIGDINNVEVNKAFTIEVTLTNSTNQPISGKTINITVNGKELTNVTDANGKASVSYTPGDNTLLEIRATFTGDPIYYANQTGKTVTVAMSQSTLTVNVDKPAVYVGEEIIINGKLRDGQNNNITEAPVTIYINGNRLTTVITNSTGEYRYTIPSSYLYDGEYNVRAVYNGITDVIISDEDTTYYSVHKMPTTLTLTVPENVKVSVPFNIEVNLKNNTGNTNAIGNKEIVITVNDIPIKTVPLTDNTGKTIISYTPVNNESLIIKAVFDSDTYYVGDEDVKTISSSNIELMDSQISVNVNKSVLYVDESVKILGRLTDEHGVAISLADVKIYINNVYTATAETNRNGEYTYTLDDLSSGQYNITVVYDGKDNIIRPTSNNTSYMVELIPTTTLVSIANNTVGSVSIDVIVKDVNNNSVTSGKLNITTPTESVIVDVTGNMTKIGLNITTTGNNKVTVEYMINDVYLNSTGVDKASYDIDPDNADTFNNITVNKIDTTIIVNVTSPVKAGNSTIISGKLVDEYDRPISNASVVVKVNDTIVGTVTTDSNGLYTLTFNNTIVGARNVTCTYGGNDTFIGSQATTKLIVEKVESNLTLNDIKDTPVGKEINITGKLEDEFANPITDAELTILVGENNITVKTDEEGKYSISIPADNVGTQNIKVIYEGSDKYNASEIEDTFKVEKINAINTLNVPEDAKPDTQANITGNIRDVDGNPIANLPVNITVNNKTYTTTTNDDGSYNLPVDNIKAGLNNVTVTAGNSTVTVSPAGDKFIAEKIGTLITIDPVDDVVVGDIINITGTLTDKNSKPITDATIQVSVNGTTSTVKTDDEGKYVLTYPTNQTGTGIIKVEYEGSSKYEDSTESTIFNINKITAKLTVNVPEQAIVGETVNITGSLTDERQNPLKHELVKLTLNGKTYQAYTDDNGQFTISVDNLVAGENSVITSVDDTKVTDNITVNELNVSKRNTTVNINTNSSVKVGDTINIKGKLLEEDGTPLANTNVTVSVDGINKNVITDNNGNYNTTFPSENVGNVTVSVEYMGSEVYSAAHNTSNASVVKRDATIRVNPVNTTSINSNISITGRLVDEDGTPVAYSVITITLNGKEYNVTTDKNGEYELPVKDARTGLNNVTLKFVDEKYNIVVNKTDFTLEKDDVIVTVDSLYGIIGENITLTAHVTDKNGNPVSGGNLVFKLNGRTLRTDGRFDTDNADPLKLKVVNGIVTFTMKADLYLRAGKNITASYSGSYYYQSAKGNVAQANIKKRTASVSVSVTPTRAKQDTDIVFTATLEDVTTNSTDKTCLITDADVIFKVNGVTIKNDKGENLRIPVTQSVVNYAYHVPMGMGGLDENGIKNYTVEAVYNNSKFYPDARNTSGFYVQRSIVNINFIKTSVKNNVLSVSATFTDYEDDYLVGENNVCVKINGKTYKENGETKYFTVTDGRVNLSGIKLASGTKVTSVTLVTGQREAYNGARATTTDIT